MSSTVSMGDSAARSKRFTTREVEVFAQLAQDNNPIHLDEAFAAGTVFGKRMVHGMLVSTPAEEPEPKLPDALRQALAAAPKAQAVWTDITPVARRDWIHWMASAKRPETRARRVTAACDMLAAGKRRVCCFDRSGMYSKSLSAPKAAE